MKLHPLVPLIAAILSLDPVAFGEALGDLVDGPVKESNNGYKGWTYGGRGGMSPDDLMSDVYYEG